MTVDPGRFEDLERRVTAHDQQLRDLTQRMSEFVGEAKGTNKVLAFIVAVSAIAQAVFMMLFHK